MADSPNAFDADPRDGNASSDPVGRVRWWRSLGPGIITASVVFGPGSLMANSKLGSTYGYELLWLIGLTAVLMGTYLVMAARIGMSASGTPCQLVAARGGRWLAVLIGLTLCGICSAFQFGNNLAIAAAVRQLGGPAWLTGYALLPLLNGLAIVFLFSFKRLYRGIERLMMLMVGVMLVAFLFNLVRVRPDLTAAVTGLIPALPEGLTLGLPRRTDDGTSIFDPMILLVALVGTTFSVGGAFYQASLVREKGWTGGAYRRGIADAIAGVCVLASISVIIMLTAGTVLRGQSASNVGELATQLRPLFGPSAHALFCLGLLAAALSSVLVNAMIGGNVLADGLGLPARLRDPGPKALTVVVLLVGMTVAMLVQWGGFKTVNAIIFGQALTVLGNPLMAGVLLWLANRRDVMGDRRNGPVLNVLGGIGLAVVVVLALRVAYRLFLEWTLPANPPV